MEEVRQTPLPERVGSRAEVEHRAPRRPLAELEQLAVLERRQEHRGLARRGSIGLSGREPRQAIALAEELALEVRLLETLGQRRVHRVGGIADVGQLHLEGGRGVGAEHEPKEPGCRTQTHVSFPLDPGYVASEVRITCAACSGRK